MFGKIITKISSFFFLDISKFVKRYFNNLSKSLKYTNIDEDLETYLSNILFISFFVAIILEILMIFLMLKLNIYFTFLSFLITIFLALTFATIVFLILYKYPTFLLSSQRKKLDSELRYSINHLSALSDEDLSVKEVLLILQNLESNKILSKEAIKILSVSDFNRNLRSTLEYICNNTYSELEHDFFKNLIDVLDKKKKLKIVINDFLKTVQENMKEEKEQRKSKINLLFETNIFLFFLVIVLFFAIFLMPLYQEHIKTLLMFIAILFPIIEIIFVFLLNK
jgi:archaellum biogenesis protein FlaJ (TadC family)